VYRAAVEFLVVADEIATSLPREQRWPDTRCEGWACAARRNDWQQVAVEKLMGEVRAIDPKDRKRWDVICPRTSATVAIEQPVEPPPGEPSTPEAGMPVPKSPAQ
jgi:hypothetical protein